MEAVHIISLQLKTTPLHDYIITVQDSGLQP